MNDIQITFLGTGASIPPPNRFQSSIAIRHKGGLFIFDVGEGAQYNLRKFKVPIRKEITIAISHAHADHYQGLGGLLASFNLLDRKEKVTIIGPPKFEEILKLLLTALQVQVSYPLIFVPMNPGDTFKGNGYSLTAIKALHFNNSLSFRWQEDPYPGKWDTTLLEKYNVPNKDRKQLKLGNSITVEDGTVIRPEDIIGPEREGRSIVYSGDTKYNPSLIKFAHKCDVLIHEATYPSDDTEQGQKREHSTVKEAAMVGRLAKADITLLTHIGTQILNFKKEKEMLKSITKTLFTFDGFVFKIPYEKVGKNLKTE